VRALLAALVVLVMGCAIAGVGMGEAPAEREPAPSQAQVAASAQRIAAAEGRRLFDDQGCGRCHAIAAAGADGKLGPRLDTLDEDAADIAESIAEPRDDIADGYPGKLMPGDYAERMDDAQIAALAAFVAAASGVEAGDDDGSGRGRNRGRGGGD